MRENLRSLQSRDVEFSGRYQRRDRRGNLLLRPASIEGRKTSHVWIQARSNEVISAPVGSLISGYATVREYERDDGSRDLGLVGARDLEVSF